MCSCIMFWNLKSYYKKNCNCNINLIFGISFFLLVLHSPWIHLETCMSTMCTYRSCIGIWGNSSKVFSERLNCLLIGIFFSYVNVLINFNFGFVREKIFFSVVKLLAILCQLIMSECFFLEMTSSWHLKGEEIYLFFTTNIRNL